MKTDVTVHTRMELTGWRGDGEKARFVHITLYPEFYFPIITDTAKGKGQSDEHYITKGGPTH